MAQRDFREELTRRVIEALEDGSAPWQRPWNGAHGAALLEPVHAVTGKPYRGMNSVNLMMAGYADPRWCTYKQAQERGWQVRRGEKSTLIEYWKFEDVRKEPDPVTKELRTVRVELKPPRVFYAQVFNCAQMDGVPPHELAAPAWDALQLGDAVIANCGVRIYHDQADAAFYMPLRDEIHAPPRGAFPSAAAYYATMFHEIGHSTGHESRLKREFGRSFGSPEYAQEELRAELASLFLSARLGIPYDFSNHASYVGSWVAKLKEDKDEIFRAARDAGRIADYVVELGLGLEQKIEEQGLATLLPPKAQSVVAHALGKGADLAWADAKTQEPMVGPIVWADSSYVVQNVDGRGVVHHFRDFAPGSFDDDGIERPYKWHGRDSWISYRDGVATLEPAIAHENARVGVTYTVGGGNLKSEEFTTPEAAVKAFLAAPGSESPSIIRSETYVFDGEQRTQASVPGQTTVIQVPGQPTEYGKWVGGNDQALIDAFAKAREAASQERGEAQKATRRRHLPREERIELFVPFAERESAKKLGAIWDGEVWYIGVDWDSAPFDRWLSPPQMVTRREIVDAFVLRCKELGLDMSDEDTSESAMMDGVWHKTTVTTSRNHNKKAGAYVLNERGYGCICNHDQGTKVPFEPEGILASEERTAEALEQYRKNLEARMAAEKALRNKVAKTAQRLCGKLAGTEDLATAQPYLLDKKSVPAFPGVLCENGTVVIPMFNAANEIRNVQRIFPDGSKRFLKDGEKKGLFFVIGDLAQADTVLFGEGYATLASPHLATRFASVVCFDSGNIGAVMEALAEATKHADRIILSDNDLVTPSRAAATLNNAKVRERHGYDLVSGDMVAASIATGAAIDIGSDGRFALRAQERREPEHFDLPRIYAEIVDRDSGEVVHKISVINVGMEKALAAAARYDAKVVAPQFADPLAYEKGYKDFNDLHVHEGLDRVQVELSAVVDLVKGRRTVELFAQERNYNLIEFVEPTEGGRYTGKVVGNVGVHSVQEVGKAQVAAHPVNALSRVPAEGEAIRIQYAGGRGEVEAGRSAKTAALAR